MSTDFGVQPPSYYHELHLKRLAKKAANGMFVFVLGVILIIAAVVATATLNPGGIVTGAGVMTGVMVGLAGVFMVYRRYWQWKNSPLEGNVETGMLLEYHAENRLLFLRGSAPDQYEFNAYSLVTPRRTWPELWFFRRSQTLQLKNNQEVVAEIRDVVDVEKLLAIDAYWSSLAKAELQNEKSQLQVQEDMLQVQRQTLSEMQALNKQFRQFFAFLTGETPLKEAPESGPITQELPAVDGAEDPDS